MGDRHSPSSSGGFLFNCKYSGLVFPQNRLKRCFDLVSILNFDYRKGIIKLNRSHSV